MGRHFYIPKAYCKRCKQTWRPTVPNPIKCAKCGSPYWDKDYAKVPTRNPKQQVNSATLQDKPKISHPSDNEANPAVEL